MGTVLAKSADEARDEGAKHARRHWQRFLRHFEARRVPGSPSRLAHQDDGVVFGGLTRRQFPESKTVAPHLSGRRSAGHLRPMHGSHGVRRRLLPALRTLDPVCEFQERGVLRNGPAGPHQKERRQALMAAIAALDPHVGKSHTFELRDRARELARGQTRGFHFRWGRHSAPLPGTSGSPAGSP
jgi:hypothetical protein